MYESNLEFEDALFAALTREDVPQDLIARVESKISAARGFRKNPCDAEVRQFTDCDSKFEDGACSRSAHTLQAQP